MGTQNLALRAAAGAGVVLAVLAGAAPAQAADQRSTIRTTVSCSAGFTGSAELRLERAGSSVWATVTSYKMSSNGRSKGNVNVRIVVPGGPSSVSSNSADAMRQDGAWHALGLTRGYDTSSRAYAEVEFVYDKKLADDPRCFASSVHF